MKIIQVALTALAFALTSTARRRISKTNSSRLYLLARMVMETSRE
jgi:hypothetical protein